MKIRIIKFSFLLIIYLSFLLFVMKTYYLIVPDNNIPKISQNNDKLWMDIKITENLKNNLEIFEIENQEKGEAIGKDITKKVIANVQQKKNYRLQLASIKKKVYNLERIQDINFSNKIKDKMGTLMDSEVSIPGLGLYVRIQTKNLFTKKEAKLLCELILKEKKPCLIVKIS